jgi:hypothetical protein
VTDELQQKWFPDEYKSFPYQAGDILAEKDRSNRICLTRILKVERIVIPKSSTIDISGKVFQAPFDDWLLVVSVLIGDPRFDSIEQAQDSVKAGQWSGNLHIPFIPPVARSGLLVGHIPILKSEFEGYWIWRKAFADGKAGILS